MTNTREWSKLTKILSRDILARVDIDAFNIRVDGTEKGCSMKHLCGALGYITMMNALLSAWVIHDRADDKEIGRYVSIDELLEDGWVVDNKNRVP